MRRPRPTIPFLLLLFIVCAFTRAAARKGRHPVHPGKLSFSLATYASDSSSCIIPFERVGNLMVIKAKVDTVEGNFVMDTGAPHLVLNLTYFRDYPVTVKHDEEQASINGRGAPIQQTTVAELAFGSLRFHRLSADLTNLGNIENAKGIKVLGLLGLELFMQCEVIVDFEKSLLLLHRIGKKEANTYEHPCLKDTAAYRTYPMEFSNNRITTAAEVAGKQLKLVVDCAAESNILDSRLPDKVFANVTVTRRVKLTGAGERQADALYGVLGSLKMGNRQIANLSVVIVNLEYTCFSDDMCVNGVLGFDFLSRQKIGFNFVKRKLYIWQ